MPSFVEILAVSGDISSLSQAQHAIVELIPLEPDVPELPLVPEEPLVPLLPLEPDVPEEPLEPDVPDEPELPLVPEEPLEPDVPELPLVPEELQSENPVTLTKEPSLLDNVKVSVLHVYVPPVTVPVNPDT